MSQPENAPADAKPKAIEILTCQLQVVSTIILVLGFGSAGLKFAFVDWPQHKTEQKERDVKSNLAETELLSINGTIWQSGLNLSDGTMETSLCPLVVNIKNEGRVPVDVEYIEFRVFTVTLRAIVNAERIEAKSGDLSIVHVKSTDNQTDQRAFVGILDMDSVRWQEQDQLRRIGNGFQVKPGQKHIQKQHLLAPVNAPSILTKVNVSVKTKTGDYHHWSGLLEPQTCMPASMLDDTSQ